MANEAWSGIDVQLKRRSELVPNLVESVKGYAAHERSVLEEVTRLRAAARALPANDVAGRAQAEGALSLALGKLVALAENYPELKASANFLELQQQLSQLETNSRWRAVTTTGPCAIRMFWCSRFRAIWLPACSASASANISRSRTRPSAMCRRSRFDRDDLQSGSPRSIAQGIGKSFACLCSSLPRGTLPTTKPVRPKPSNRSIRCSRGQRWRDDGHRNDTRTGGRPRNQAWNLSRFPADLQKDAGGNVREVDFSLLGVERDGKPEAHSTTRQRGVIRIYAGSQDTIVSRGEHTYVFRYRTARQVRWFDGKPELNWNVTGNFWRFPDFQSQLPAAICGGDEARCVGPPLPGVRGRRGTDWRGSLGALGTLNVETTRRLAPGEGLTVVAEIPAEAIDAPSQNALLWYEIFDNRQWIFGGIGLVLVLGYYFAAWNAVGRDPKGGVIIPLFQPPAAISPALANYIRDWGFAREKWRAFTAAALSLAVRGLLHFDDRGGSLTLKATGKTPAGSDAGRRGCDHSPGSRDRVALQLSAARTATPSPRLARISPKASRLKTATASSAAISATSSRDWQ